MPVLCGGCTFAIGRLEWRCRGEVMKGGSAHSDGYPLLAGSRRDSLGRCAGPGQRPGLRVRAQLDG